MNDDACVRFLQWALPYLHMRWPGFRKVRKQVCKRINRRMQELALSDIDAYKDYLLGHDSEWHLFDSFCRITISRFYRDKRIFQYLADTILPDVISKARSRGTRVVRCWSAGCASGEEPYSLALLWGCDFASRYSDMNIEIIATDADNSMLQRAAKAGYTFNSLKNLPAHLVEAAFCRKNKLYYLQENISNRVTFMCQDIRQAMPDGLFHLVLCRNLAFTYFDQDLQEQVAQRIGDAMHEGGILVAGVHESLPEGVKGFLKYSPHLPVYLKEK